MSLTDEQCVEIAKLWGEDTVNKPFGPNVDRFRKIAESWSGFGRTVEAMAPKWQLAEYYHKEDHVTRIGFVDKELKFFPIIWDYSEPLGVITATHLAALEAIK